MQNLTNWKIGKNERWFHEAKRRKNKPISVNNRKEESKKAKEEIKTEATEKENHVAQENWQYGRKWIVRPIRWELKSERLAGGTLTNNSRLSRKCQFRRLK